MRPVRFAGAPGARLLPTPEGGEVRRAYAAGRTGRAVVLPAARQVVLFVDQRWLDLVPALFDYEVVRDPGWNAAFWNLDTRRVEVGADGYTIDGSPLAFFHFSGYDPHRPYLLSTWLLPSPRVLLSESPALLALSRAHAGRLLENGWDAAHATRYRYATTTSGGQLDRNTRRRYRDALLEAERTGAAKPRPLVVPS